MHVCCIFFLLEPILRSGRSGAFTQAAAAPLRLRLSWDSKVLGTGCGICQKRICEWEELTISFSGCSPACFKIFGETVPGRVCSVVHECTNRAQKEKWMRREHDEHEGQTHGEGHPTCSSGSMGYFGSPSLESIKGTYAFNNGPS